MNPTKLLPKLIIALGRVMPGVMFFLLMRNADANPTGMTVQSGSASLSASGSQLTITAGNNAFLNWQSFNIAAGQTTIFNQPSASSIVWNRVNDPNPSQIYGSLQANGVVVLLNSSGFYFGPNSFVSAAGLVVSTANCLPPQNAGGSWEFNGPPPLASIVNYGTIKVGNGGDVFLIADQVQNQGDIAAPGGNIALAAGQTVTVSERPDGRGMSMQVTLPQGSVDNYGNLIADGGTISLNAQVVNQNGFIQANSVRSQNGVIELVASDSLNLGANSTILAQGDDSAAGSAGGTVTLKSGNTFSDTAGGEIITAGGAHGGNGGNIEVSAPNVESLASTMNAGAQAGFTAGEFLLDPVNIILGTSTAGGAINVNTAFAGFSSIILQATGNITLNANTVWDLSGSTTMNQGQLTLEAGGNIVLGTGSQIMDANAWAVTLEAGYNFINNSINSGKGAITFDNGSSIQTAQGNISLLAGSSISIGTGSVSATGSGNILATATAGSLTIDSGTVQTESGAINLNAGQTIQDNSGSLNALDGGNISAVAGTELDFGSGTVDTTGNGSVTMTAKSGALNIDSGSIQTEAGTINLSAGQGLADNSGSINTLDGGNISAVAGTELDFGTGIVQATGIGSVTMTAKSGDLNIDSGSVQSDSGAINLSAGQGLTDNSGAINTTDGGSIAVVAGTDLSLGGAVAATGAGGIVATATAGSITIDPGTITTSAGDINLTAEQDITVGAGYVITTGGGSITAHALTGSIDTGSDAQGYHFTSNAGSLSQAYNLSDGLGGISTEAGGDVNLTAGGDVTSVLPANKGYYYDGSFVTAQNNDYTTAGSGAYGPEAGNVTIIAGGNVTGNYVVANGVGSIFAGVTMDASGNPVKNALGNYVLGGSGSAGTDLLKPDLALDLVKGGWNVTAAQDIILQEVLNPNGVFDVSGGAAYDHYFDYAPGDFVNLTAGNLVQLGGSSSVLPRVGSLAVPVIYPSILNITAGAGGVAFVGDFIFNQLILFPSPQGSLTINTSDGGPLVGQLPFSGGAPQIFDLIVSDSGNSQYLTSGDFGANDHAATPVHAGSEMPVVLNISGDMDLMSLIVPEAAQITVGGDMDNCRFQGMNLSADDTTSIHVTGDILNRSAFTSVNLTGVSGAVVANLPLLADAVNNSINGNSISAATLVSSIFYNSSTKVLTYQNIPGVSLPSVLNLLANLTVQVYDNGVPQFNADGTPATKTVSIINAAAAAALETEYATLGPIPSGTGGFVIGGGGTFAITGRTIDLGTTEGIQSLGVGLYQVGNSYPLASYFSQGANIVVTTTGNHSEGMLANGDLVGDLTMYSSSIANLNGGSISIQAGGDVNAGSSDFTVTSDAARGIFTTGLGDVTVIANNDINVAGSRIAAYDGGNVTVESLEGNINAGSGGSGFVVLTAYYVDPTTGQVYTDSPTIPGSGILATTFPPRNAAYPAPPDIVGNILVEAPNGNVNASSGGIVQLALNGVNNASSIVEVLAGLQLEDSGGNPVTAADIANGSPVQVSGGRNINANGSGVIGDTVTLDASGSITGVIFARDNIDLTAQQSVSVTALAQGTINVTSGGTVSGTIIGVGGVSASGSSIDANLESNNGVSGDTSGSKGLAPGTAANATSQAASASDASDTAAKSDTTGDDDPLKKKKNITLARKVGRVTVLLPGKN
jgi:filamentous hemagglutinin family protein